MRFYQILAKSQPDDFDKETVEALPLDLFELSDPQIQEIAVLFYHGINKYMLLDDTIYQCWPEFTELTPELEHQTEGYSIRKLGPWISPQIKSSILNKIEEHFTQDNFALV